MTIYIALVFGLFTLIGGVMGFVKAGSKASLISGGISGLLILACTYGLWQNQPWGFWGLLAISLILETMFGKKFAKTKAVMPAGIMILLSSVTIVMLMLQFFQKVS